MVVIVVLAAVFPILISTFQGVRGLDPVLLETARTFQVSRWRTIFSIVLPASLPMILAGMRVALGLGLVLVILAEMLAGEDGIGFRVLDLQRAFQIREMFAWIFVLVVLGAQTVAFRNVVVSSAVTGSCSLLEVFVSGGRGILLTNSSDVGHNGQGREGKGRKSR